jgi:hypothetical protein
MLEGSIGIGVADIGRIDAAARGTTGLVRECPGPEFSCLLGRPILRVALADSSRLLDEPRLADDNWAQNGMLTIRSIEP